MAFKLPTVADQRVQQALNVLSKQFPIGNANLALAHAAGSVELEWTAKSNASATATVSHGLGRAAVTAGGWTPITSSCFVEAEPSGDDKIKLRARYPFGELPAETKVLVRWIAIG